MLQRGRPRPPFPRRPGCPRASSRRPRHRGGHRGHRRCRTGARRPGAGGEVGLCTASLLHGAFTGRRNGITGLEGKGESTSGLIPGRTKPSGVGVLPGAAPGAALQGAPPRPGHVHATLQREQRQRDGRRQRQSLLSGLSSRAAKGKPIEGIIGVVMSERGEDFYLTAP